MGNLRRRYGDVRLRPQSKQSHTTIFLLYKNDIKKKEKIKIRTLSYKTIANKLFFLFRGKHVEGFFFSFYLDDHYVLIFSIWLIMCLTLLVF